MLRTPSLLGTIAALLVTAAASLAQAGEPDQKRVATSIAPLTSVIEAIGGDHVDVMLMVPSGVHPKNYEPSPSQMADLESAALYVEMGVPPERNFMPQIRAARPDMPIIRMLDVVETRTIIGTGENAGREIPDHHIWLGAPQLRSMAAAISEELSRIMPEHADSFAANTEAWLVRLNAADARARALLEPHKGRAFLVFHPAFGYMADAYGLRQIAIEVQGMEPGPRMIAAAIDAARKEDIKVVFVQSQFSTEEAETIAKEIGGEVVKLDQLHPDPVLSIDVVATAFAKAFE